MDAPLDPALIDALGQVLAKGGSAATLILAYFGWRIFRAIVSFLGSALQYMERLYSILDRLDKHLGPVDAQSSPNRPLPDTLPTTRRLYK